jgi:hypothetical protein
VLLRDTSLLAMASIEMTEVSHNSEQHCDLLGLGWDFSRNGAFIGRSWFFTVRSYGRLDVDVVHATFKIGLGFEISPQPVMPLLKSTASSVTGLFQILLHCHLLPRSTTSPSTPSACPTWPLPQPLHQSL